MRTWTEGDDLQALQAKDNTCHGHKLCYHLSHFLGSTHRILGDIALEVAHTKVVRAVEHTTVGITTTVDHISVALGSSDKHARTIEVLCNQCFRSLRTKVSKEYNQCVATSLFHFCHCLEHIFLVLYSGLAVEQLTLVGLYDILTTLC